MLLALGCGPGLGPGAAPTGASKAALVVLPEDGDEVLLATFAQAQRSLDLEAYWLSEPRALAELAAAAARGVRVRAVLEPAPYGAVTANQPAWTTLAAAGADVRWSQRNGYLHAKSWLVDGRTLVITTANLTTAGLVRNRELGLVLDGEIDAGASALVTTWKQVFAADFAGTGADERLAAEAARLALARAGTVDTPEDGLVVAPVAARAPLMALVAAAKRRIVIETEVFDAADVTEALVHAADEGRDVTVLVSEANALPSTQATRLLQGGVALRLMRAPYLHAKVFLVDDRVYALGSPNVTRSAWDENRELALLGRAPAVVARLAAILDEDRNRATPWPAP